MAASISDSKGTSLSKADYLKRYLSGDGDTSRKEKKTKKKRIKTSGKGMKIVDDDVDWKQLVSKTEEIENEEDDEAPVVAEFVDERPEEVKQLEAFRTSNKWKAMGSGDSTDLPLGAQDTDVSARKGRHDSPDLSPRRKTRHDSPDLSPRRKARHDSPDLSPRRKARHDSPDLSPRRKARHDSPDLSPRRKARHDSPDLSPRRKARHDSPDLSPRRKARHDSPDLSPRRKARHDSPDLSPRRKARHDSPDLSPRRKARLDSPELLPPRQQSRAHRHSPHLQRSPCNHSKRHDKGPKRSAIKGKDLILHGRAVQTRQNSDSDKSPPQKRKQYGDRSDSDLSPPRRQPTGGSDSDLSPPRRTRSPASQSMLSGGAAGLVSVETLRKEQAETLRREKQNQAFEEKFSNVETVFRDKTGRRRNIESERIEQSIKAAKKTEKEEKYAQWGKGLAQEQIQQQNLEDALREAQKPLARHIDDEDLDRMLREQQREGDPMAALLHKKKLKDSKVKGIKERPRYKGPPPPPNRFNLMPGYRWDGVDRSNGFEQKRYSRLADKKAVQEMAYKWSVEDM
ncbi:BUD13 homolog [Denticeps clupeoides]|uniref:BUD13 homolog n=1 Tax=Denticeps clupeoides TaxID=299321 RepID=UPI0010A58340|nr:BUD13 homolog [Denticeps clupeoides]